jgi:hypothetical protein
MIAAAVLLNGRVTRRAQLHVRVPGGLREGGPSASIIRPRAAASRGAFSFLLSHQDGDLFCILAWKAGHEFVLKELASTLWAVDLLALIEQILRMLGDARSAEDMATAQHHLYARV